MYSEDSFLTLSLWGKTGLIAVSLMLSFLALALVVKMRKRTNRAFSVLVALIVFAGFIWLSPQVYYLYYMLLFDELTLKSVLDAPPHPEQLLSYMAFGDRATLSSHSKGVLGWALVITGLWPRRKKGAR